MSTWLYLILAWLTVSLLVGLLVGRQLGRTAASGDERISRLAERLPRAGNSGVAQPHTRAGTTGAPHRETPARLDELRPSRPDDYVLGHRVHAVDGRRVYEVRR